MRRGVSVVVAGLALMALAERATAAIRPSFHFEECAWNATDIVVTTQGEKAGEPLTVIEAWSGPLAKGDKIRLKGLPEAPVEVSTMFGAKPMPASVGGGRIVLFLKPERAEAGAAPSTEPGVKLFDGANTVGGGQVSAVWIEQGQGYAFEQIMNPGPSELHPLQQSEADLKKEVMGRRAAKDALAKAKALEKTEERVAALGSLANGPYLYEQRDALEMLGGCGKAALPVLAKLLHDDHCDQRDLMHAIAAASGDDAGQEITAILKDELPFWQAEGPKLQVGWWNADPAERRQVLRNRYDLLDRGLAELKGLRYLPSEGVVTQIRDLWESLPQLNDKSGPNASVECEKVLTALDLNGSPRPAGPKQP